MKQNPLHSPSSLRRRTLRATTLLLALLCTCAASADNWMSRLPDDAYVCVLSIPGAHDAATGSGWAEGMEDMGDAFARTQELSIAQLWDIGIRAFDFRPCCYESHLNINHGMVPTSLHFEDVLLQLRDSLAANPSEFIIIHMLHETDGDQVENVYNQRILELLGSDELQGLFVDFRKDLRVADLRGHILLISRDAYASKPIGGFFQNWTMEANWNKQQQMRIAGPKGYSPAVVQDFCETWQDGALQTKINAINKLLDYSTKRKTTSASTIRWVFNLASAYSLVQSLFGYNISISDGYRDNATHTHAAILDYLATHTPGPTGIILMDYAGVDQSGDFRTRGRELVDAIIANNFLYIDQFTGVRAPATFTPQPGSTDGSTVGETSTSTTTLRNLSGQPVKTPQRGNIYIHTRPDGTSRTVVR